MSKDSVTVKYSKDAIIHELTKEYLTKSFNFNSSDPESFATNYIETSKIISDVLAKEQERLDAESSEFLSQTLKNWNP